VSYVFIGRAILRLRIQNTLLRWRPVAVD